MKNLINYYYNLMVTQYKKIEDSFVFIIDNKNYCFIPFYGDITELYKSYSILKTNNKYCHEIILNKENSSITFYENKPYILLKKHVFLKNIINLNDILEYNISVYDVQKLNWKELWQNKIDYYEYQINQFGFKYKKLRESFSYYIGMSETAINLINQIDSSDIKFCVCHRRINYKEDLDEFFNPANMILDSRTRDITEYFKVNYINGKINIDSIINALDHIDFNYDENLLIMARLLYPSFYFDVYDMVIQEKISEDKVNFFIEKNTYYETLLKSVYRYLRIKFKIPEIEWLEV